MRAVHPLAPVTRWGQLDDTHRMMAQGIGVKTLRAIAEADGWWELGVGQELVRWKPPGHRKPWVCLVMKARELSQLEQLGTTASARERFHQHRADWANE